MVYIFSRWKTDHKNSGTDWESCRTCFDRRGISIPGPGLQNQMQNMYSEKTKSMHSVILFQNSFVIHSIYIHVYNNERSGIYLNKWMNQCIWSKRALYILLHWETYLTGKKFLRIKFKPMVTLRFLTYLTLFPLKHYTLYLLKP